MTGLELRKARTQRGINQEALAARLGVHRKTIYHLEKNPEPGRLYVLAICATLADLDAERLRASVFAA